MPFEGKRFGLFLELIQNLLYSSEPKNVCWSSKWKYYETKSTSLKIHLATISSFCIVHYIYWASLLAQVVKNPLAMWETWVQSLAGRIPWRREWLPTLVFLPGEFHGQRSLTGYSPWDHKELDMTERLSHHLFILRSTNVGNQSKYSVSWDQ